MELRHIRYFVAVAKELNVTRAATLMHISQPALSRQIRDLEEEIGTKLLERTANSITLTPCGKIFLQECYIILKRVDDAVEKVRLKSKPAKTVIRIGYAATPTVEILNESMQAFQKKHPSVKIELFDLSSNGIIKGVRENKLDLGLTVAISPQSFEGLALDELGTYDVNVAFSKTHRFSKMKVVPLSEVAKEDLITFTRAEHPEAIIAMHKILRDYTDEPKIVMECDGISSLFTAVESGQGIALGFATMGKLAGSRLLVRPLNPAPPRLPIAVIYNKNRLSEAALDYLAIIKNVKSKSLKARKSVLVV